MDVLSAVAKRAVAQKAYKEKLEPLPKTKQSKETRVDKRMFNKGRPKIVSNVSGQNIVVPPTPAPPKKLNAIEKLAGQIIGGFIRAKLDAMDMQPAIYSEMIGNRIKDKLDKGQPINFDTLMTSVAKTDKRKGRPKGAKDKQPRKKKDTNL
jgi:hypothetical protein